MQVSPNVRAVQVPDVNPMHPQFTTIYLVGRGQVLTIDAGEDSERYRWMLRGYLAATEKAEIAMSTVSHHHRDHTGNLRWLRDEFQSEIYVPELAEPLLGDMLPPTGVHLLPDEGDVEVSGDVHLRLFLTPGHSTDSVCYFLEDEGVLFSGDTILGASTTTFSDLGVYLETLKRLRALPNLRVICPGHGPLIYDPQDHIDDYIRRREVRDREILAMLAPGRPLTSREMVENLYSNADRRLWRAADRVVQAHLQKLATEGKIVVQAGVPKSPSPEETARAAAEDQERLDLIKKADEYKLQMQRRAIGLQESGGLGLDWQEPPLYSIVGAN